MTHDTRHTIGLLVLLIGGLLLASIALTSCAGYQPPGAGLDITLKYGMPSK